jgi:AraC-like DNA-binding protein
LNSFGPLGYLAATSLTLADALRRLQRYTRYLTNMETYALLVEGEVARLRFVREPWFPMMRQVAEHVLAIPHVHTRAVALKPWQLSEVSFAHPRPERTAEHARLFGCPVRFGAPHDELVFPSAMLDSPSRVGDGKLAEILEGLAERLLKETTSEPDLLARARFQVWTHLQKGDVAIEPVARDLGLSPRTLQRRLLELGTSHRRILDEVRAQMAGLLLARPHKLLDIALLLGFSDQTAFHKAFRRWTGSSPAKTRRPRPDRRAR